VPEFLNNRFSRTPDSPGGRLNFVKFETQHINDCVDFVYKVLHEENDQQIPLTQRVIKGLLKIHQSVAMHSNR
jgi:pantothenate kinase